MANTFTSVHVLWSSTDEQFFRVTAELFSPTFLAGAGVLLTSYDPDSAAGFAGSSPTRPAAAQSAPAATAVTA